jgi:hypothetical protein
MVQYHRHVNAHTPVAPLPLAALCLAAFRPEGSVMAVDQLQKTEP